jgi:phosphoadenosine phosphosulfate reductase
MQDLENTPERVGRGQDKEQVMEQLRALGYM